MYVTDFSVFTQSKRHDFLRKKIVETLSGLVSALRSSFTFIPDIFSLVDYFVSAASVLAFEESGKQWCFFFFQPHSTHMIRVNFVVTRC